MSNQHLYLGKAGQFAVMAECLMRGFNVAVPEVDIGDDLFVVNDQSGNYRRMQVKTITAKQAKLKPTNYSAQFQVPYSQLVSTFQPELIYVFVPRFALGWGPFLVIPRDALYTLHDLYEVGRRVSSKGTVQFSVSFSGNGTVHCNKVSLQQYVNRFEGLPDLIQDSPGS